MGHLHLKIRPARSSLPGNTDRQVSYGVTGVLGLSDAFRLLESLGLPGELPPSMPFDTAALVQGASLPPF